MALSSILSLGLHLTIFLFFYYGLPLSKINDRKETTIPLIFEEELEVSNKTNLKKNEKLVKSQKKKKIGSIYTRKVPICCLSLKLIMNIL